MAVPTPPEGAPHVTLCGRANVGKSTLFNRLVGRRLALVYDEPGVTRDRLQAGCRIGEGDTERWVWLTDTAGLAVGDDAPLQAQSLAQTEEGLLQADLALLVVDGRAGCTPYDIEAARTLRRRGRAFAVIVNKAEGRAHDGALDDFYRLGGEQTLAVSAEHGLGIDALRAFLATRLGGLGLAAAPPVAPAANDDTALDGPLPTAKSEPPDADGRIEWDGGPIRVAILGRPNAGKSSLCNALLGERRLMASPISGTTRDSIDCSLHHNGQAFVLVDTAGIRRRSRVRERLEALSVSVALASLERADVVVLVLNGTERVSDQDARIAALADAKGKGLVLVASQWDRIENAEWKRNFGPAVRHDLPFCQYAPLVNTSAVRQQGLDELLDAIVTAQRERHRRVGTGALNRFVAEAIGTHPPPMRRGKRPQIAYASQPMVRPPTFVLHTRRGGLLDESYKRYLVRQLRARYGFAGTPVWVKFRASGAAAQGREKPT